MPPLSLRLLGTFHVQVGETTITDFHSQKVRALLGFLAVESDRAHERELLAGLLWPELPGEHGLTNLRQALHRLGQALQPAPLDAPPLLVTRHAVQANPAAGWSVDAVEFAALLDEAARHRHRRAEACPACALVLQRAMALCRGDLLAGFAGIGSLPFEEWLLRRREHLRQQQAEALAQLARYHELHGDDAQAMAALRRWLAIEPWREEAHRTLIALHARRGDRSAALAQFAACRRALAAELEIEPSPETLALVSAVRSGTLAPAAPPSSALPARTSPIVGRDALLAQLIERLNDHDTRIVTLLGMGGSGKTRLAIEAAGRVAAAYRDGVCFVPLAAARSPDAMLAEIARALGVYSGDRVDLERQLATYLSGRALLLVLDSFERLAEHAALLLPLLAAAPGVALLVTSRQALRLEGEWLLRVEALPPPPAGWQPGGAPLESFAASALFLQTARHVSPGVALDAAAQRAIAAICRLVGGLPLALNLVASQIGRRTPVELAQALRQDLGLLEAPLRDLPERQQSLHAVLDETWALLLPAEQHLLGCCALFAGGFGVAAALAVAACPLPHPAPSRANLDALVDRSLVGRTTDGRYALHDLVRRFALTQLERGVAGDPEAARDRHSAHYLARLAAFPAGLLGPGARSELAALVADRDDLRLAWRRAVERGRTGDLLAALPAMADFFVLNGMYAEGAAAFGLAGADQQEGDHELRAQLLVRLGRMLYFGGDYPLQQAVAEEAVALARGVGLALVEAAALVELGMAQWRQGAPRAALGLLRRAIELARGEEPATRRVAADARYYLGVVLWNQGVFAEAREQYEQALELSRSIGYRYGEGDALNNLALVDIFEGAYVAAVARLDAALAAYATIANLGGEGLAQISRGLALMYLGDFPGAQAALEQSVAIHWRIGDRHNAAVGQTLLGMVHTRLGSYLAARVALADGLAQARAIAHHWGACMALAYDALAAYLAGAHAEGAERAAEALALAEQIGDPVLAAYALTHQGHALAALGRADEAAAAYQRAVATRTAIGQRHLLPDPLAGLVCLALDAGDHAGAAALAAQLVEIAAATGLAGCEEPVRIALTAHRALLAVGDPEAPEVLRLAHRLLAAQRARGADPAIYWRVAAHRTLLSMRHTRERVA